MSKNSKETLIFTICCAITLVLSECFSKCGTVILFSGGYLTCKMCDYFSSDEDE